MSATSMISVIIPVLHEGPEVVRLAASLVAIPGVQVIVVDGDPHGSTLALFDETDAGQGLLTLVSRPGRGAQLAAGAEVARGDILLFLHADSKLPDGWNDTVRRVLGRGFASCGAFSLAFDAPGWLSGLVGRWATLRSRLDRRPYGDQAQFFTARAYHGLGGYADIPLMEDVEIMSRAVRAGMPPIILPDKVTTSARRYRKEGWLIRGAKNWLLRLRHAMGAPPSRLARHYRPQEREQSEAGASRCVLFFLKWPEPGKAKTRLAADVGDEVAVRFARAMAEDTLELFDSMRDDGGLDVMVCFAPADREADMRTWLGQDRQYLPQRGADLGQRMASGFEEAFELGYDRVILVGSDIPTMQAGDLRAAFAALENRDACVLGPAEDGGYWLVGMRRDGFVREVFADMAWSTSEVMAESVVRLRRAGRSVVTTPVRRDVDTLADLRAMRDRGEGMGVRTTRLLGDLPEPEPGR